VQIAQVSEVDPGPGRSRGQRRPAIEQLLRRGRGISCPLALRVPGEFRITAMEWNPPPR
jgi:hypothetical protein